MRTSVWFRRLLVVSFVAATVWLHVAQSRLAIDVQNRALKARGSLDAARMRERTERFGDDEVVLVALSGPAAQLGERAGPWIEELRQATPGSVVIALDARAPDVRAFACVLPGEHEPAARTRVVQAFADRARAHPPADCAVAVTGQELGEVVVADAIQREERRTVPVIALGLLGLLTVLYRHVGVALAILLPAGAAIVWTRGFYALAGYELHPVGALLAPVLLTVGVAGGLHFAEDYLARRAAGTAADPAERETRAELLAPALLACATTAAGLLTMALHQIPALVSFGLFAALGVALAFLFTWWGTPALLSTLARGLAQGRLAEREAWAAHHGRVLGAWLLRHARAIVVCATLLAVGAAVAMRGATVDNDPLRALPRRSAFLGEVGVFERALGGSDAFDLVLHAPVDAAGLALERERVAHLDGVVGPVGPAVVAADGSALQAFLLAPAGSSERERLFAAVDAPGELRVRDAAEPTVHAAGASVQIARDSGRLIRGQIGGILATSLALLGLFWIGFRSLRLAALAMLPNLWPCLLLYGGLALAGRPLSVATAMISSVLLGVIVDDTIHGVHRYQLGIAAGLGRDAAVLDVLSRVGRATLYMSLSLAAGFGLCAFGEMRTTQEFGLLSAATIALALVGDLVLLPALLSTFGGGRR